MKAWLKYFLIFLIFVPDQANGSEKTKRLLFFMYVYADIPKGCQEGDYCFGGEVFQSDSRVGALASACGDSWSLWGFFFWAERGSGG